MTIEMVMVLAMVLAVVVVALVVFVVSPILERYLRWSDRRHHRQVVRWSRAELKASLRERSHVGWAEGFGYPEGLVPYHRQLALASWSRPSSCAQAQARLLEAALLLALIVEEGAREEAAPAFGSDLEDVLFQ